MIEMVIMKIAVAIAGVFFLGWLLKWACNKYVANGLRKEIEEAKGGAMSEVDSVSKLAKDGKDRFVVSAFRRELENIGREEGRAGDDLTSLEKVFKDYAEVCQRARKKWSELEEALFKKPTL